jgi:hypothetical protein
MTSFFSKFRRRLSRHGPQQEVKFDRDGFSVFEESTPKGRVLWSEVVEVFAYKLDLGTYDEMCIGFRIDADGTHWCVSEEFVGYQELIQKLRDKYPGIRDDWFSTVAFPAFAPNRTTLWGESWTPPSK